MGPNTHANGTGEKVQVNALKKNEADMGRRVKVGQPYDSIEGTRKVLKRRVGWAKGN